MFKIILNYKYFDKRKLKEVNGMWDLNACTGNKFLREINPMNMKGLTKKEIIRLINRIVSQSYLFIGYEQFSNFVKRISKKNTDDESAKQNYIKNIKREFSNRLIVIDEIHNIRITKDTPNKNTAKKSIRCSKIY